MGIAFKFRAQHITESKMHGYGEAATAVPPLSRWSTVRDFAEFVADKGLQEVFNLKLLEPPRILESSELLRRRLLRTTELPRKSLTSLSLKPLRTSLPPLLEEV